MRPAFILTLIAWTTAAYAQGITDPPLPDGTAEAEKRIPSFRVPDGVKVSLFAAEPQLASPVAIGLDEQGRVFVAEEYRFNRGTEENRTRPFLLEDDLHIGTLEERLAMFRKHADKFQGGMEWFTKYTDQVRLLADTNNDGRADRSTVFADGFNGTLDGLMAGVMARDGDVYVTCIPHLWRLRDKDGDGMAEVREKLLTGFGVNAGFLGHDLHGLVWGPDGKLYFSVGDRGFDVRTKEDTTLSLPRRGAVFRCQPDGTELEVVHIGLRNPQELAFDDFGNLFADDNNCDKGDDARLVYIVEGGDSGWNMAYQTIPEPYLVGPWHAEKMWHAANDDQPAWLLPRVGRIGAGPSGFTYYPGVGLPEKYRGHFFMANYTGNGGIETFAVKPSGASFELVDQADFFKPISATDCEFGYDGKLYVSDFVGLDWSGKSRGGRIYVASHEASTQSPIALETAKLFREGFRQRSNEELAKLLAHPDQRVRLRSQYTLAERKEEAFLTFTAAAAQLDERFARLHGLWGLGQIARTVPAAKEAIAEYLDDHDDEIRAQAAKLAGDVLVQHAANKLMAMLEDKSPRVQFFAAQSLGKLRHRPATEALFALLARNNNADRCLRHACVYALHRLSDGEANARMAKHPEPAVRMGILLVWRLEHDPRVADFLVDDAPQLVTEAARAINDLHFDDLTGRLTNLSEQFAKSPQLANDALARRVINAHFRIGKKADVEAVARMAVDPLFSMAVRREALLALGDWLTPGNRDRVTGFWRPLGERDPQAIKSGLPVQTVLSILANSPQELRPTAISMALKLKLEGGDDVLAQWVRDPNMAPNQRASALRLLAQSKKADAEQFIKQAEMDSNEKYRAAVLEVAADLDPNYAEQRAIHVLQTPVRIREAQSAFAILAQRKTTPADDTLRHWAEKLKSSQVSRFLELDVVEACRQRNLPELMACVHYFEAANAAVGPFRKWQVSLNGGDAERGRSIFVNNSRAQCIRCHRTPEINGGNAGPELSALVSKKGYEHLLESLIDPNAKIAEGFGSFTFVLENGKVIVGLIKKENDLEIEVVTPQGEKVLIARDQIEERTPAKSPMPAMDTVLSPREMRDLVEFLANLPEPAKQP